HSSNCCAALRVKVKPRPCSGRTNPLATKDTTRDAMVSVFPAPAPAVTSFGPSPPAMTCACSSVGANFLPTAAAISAGEKLGVDISSHLSFSLHRANGFQWAAITLGADPGGYPRAS